MNAVNFDFEDDALNRGATSESGLLLPQERCRSDSWASKAHILIVFLWAYTSVTRNDMIIFLSFYVIAPLIERDHVIGV